MTYIPPRFNGQHDFGGRCDPYSWDVAITGQKSFSVGIFEYVTTKNGAGLKRGPVKVRVTGPVSYPASVYRAALAIVDALDAGEYQGPKRVTVR